MNNLLIIAYINFYLVGKYGVPGTNAGPTSVHSQKSPMGSVVVTSDKEGGKPTSGYLPADPLLISDSAIPPVVSSHHPRSNSQTSCFQEDGYCIAVTKNAEGEFYSCFLFSNLPSSDKMYYRMLLRSQMFQFDLLSCM